MTPAEALRDALARIILAQEWFTDGAVGEAMQVLYDLENDLLAVLREIES